MDDLISRQAAIEALGEKPWAWTEGEYELGLRNQWQSDINALKALPSAQPEKRTEKRTETHACDLISRQAAIDAVNRAVTQEVARWSLQELPSAQPEQNPDEWCTDCKEYDQTKHCCPRFNRVIRETIKEMRENERDRFDQ